MKELSLEEKKRALADINEIDTTRRNCVFIGFWLLLMNAVFLFGIAVLLLIPKMGLSDWLNFSVLMFLFVVGVVKLNLMAYADITTVYGDTYFVRWFKWKTRLFYWTECQFHSAYRGVTIQTATGKIYINTYQFKDSRAALTEIAKRLDHK